MDQHNEEQISKWLELVSQPCTEEYALFLNTSDHKLHIMPRTDYNWEVTSNNAHLLLIDIFDEKSKSSDITDYEAEIRAKTTEYLESLPPMD